MTELKVSLSERSYPIHIGNGAFGLAFENFSQIVRNGGKIACVADESLLSLFPQSAEKLKSLGIHLFPVHGGEPSKSFEMLEKLCESFAVAGLDRKSTVAAWGGGVIGDLAGFAAHCPCSNSHNLAFDGRFLRRRKDRHKYPRRKKSRRGIPPAARRIYRHFLPFDPPDARIFRGHG